MITERSAGDIAVLTPRFREETVHEDVEALVARVQALATAGNRKLIVDLSDTEHCADDAAGALGKVWACYQRLGGRVAVSGPSAALWHLFRMCKLDQVLDLYETEGEAIASFGRP